MSQHFLMSAAARSLSIGKVMRMSDQGAENVFARLRWPTTDGKPVCPDCGCATCYDCRRGAYAQEAAWREDHRGISNGDQVYGVIGLAMGLGPSVDFCGYWQRAAAA